MSEGSAESWLWIWHFKLFDAPALLLSFLLYPPHDEEGKIRCAAIGLDFVGFTRSVIWLPVWAPPAWTVQRPYKDEDRFFFRNFAPCKCTNHRVNSKNTQCSTGAALSAQTWADSVPFTICLWKAELTHQPVSQALQKWSVVMLRDSTSLIPRLFCKWAHYHAILMSLFYLWVHVSCRHPSLSWLTASARTESQNGLDFAVLYIPHISLNLSSLVLFLLPFFGGKIPRIVFRSHKCHIPPNLWPGLAFALPGVDHHGSLTAFQPVAPT